MTRRRQHSRWLAVPALALGVQLAIPQLVRAQGLGFRTEVRLTPYFSAGHWRREGDLLGGGVTLDRSVGTHFWLFTDLGVARLISGCPPEIPTACPKTAWHVLGGLRASLLSPRAGVRPYLAIALGRQDLLSTASVLRGEAGADVRPQARFAIRLGVSFATSLRGETVRLWGVAGGLNFPL